jgi:hypothetical protein
MNGLMRDVFKLIWWGLKVESLLRHGVSRKMRHYQAGPLGVDAVIVLDESHLVPPFAHLLHVIEEDLAVQPEHEPDSSMLRASLVSVGFLPRSNYVQAVASAPAKKELILRRPAVPPTPRREPAKASDRAWKSGSRRT